MVDVAKGVVIRAGTRALGTRGLGPWAPVT